VILFSTEVSAAKNYTIKCACDLVIGKSDGKDCDLPDEKEKSKNFTPTISEFTGKGQLLGITVSMATDLRIKNTAITACKNHCRNAFDDRKFNETDTYSINEQTDKYIRANASRYPARFCVTAYARLKDLEYGDELIKGGKGKNFSDIKLRRVTSDKNKPLMKLLITKNEQGYMPCPAGSSLKPVQEPAASKCLVEYTINNVDAPLLAGLTNIGIKKITNTIYINSSGVVFRDVSTPNDIWPKSDAKAKDYMVLAE
jgi:hypothetical protein